MSYVPHQGDIVTITFDPRLGHEQKGRRPGLVISNDEYHKRTKNLALICPITNTVTGFPMHIKLDDRTNTKGVIMCEQIISLDYKKRNVVYEEFVPDDILDNVIDTVCSSIE